MNLVRKTILMVEDDSDDRDFLQEALLELHPGLTIIEARTGPEALKYLRAVGPGQEMPSLVILDINLPLLDGKEVFSAIRLDPALREVPLVVFTSSENPTDQDYFASRGVALFTKPNHYARMPQLAEQLLAYSG